MFNLYLNRWTLSLISVVVGAVVYVLGFETIALVGVLLVVSFIIIGAAKQGDNALTSSYLSGVVLGVAGIVWIYSLLATFILVPYMYGVVKSYKPKLFFSFLFGVMTPFWVALPFYLYYNQDMITDFVNDIVSRYD